MASVVTVLVWQWSPFMMLIVLAGLQGQDTSVLEAARVDGATSFGIFRQITLPQLRPIPGARHPARSHLLDSGL